METKTRDAWLIVTSALVGIFLGNLIESIVKYTIPDPDPPGIIIVYAICLVFALLIMGYILYGSKKVHTSIKKSIK